MARKRRPPTASKPRIDWAAPRVVLALVVVAALPRLWAAYADQGMFWPDEIFQSIEQAHRLAFGAGMLPWEFVDGARSWVFPGALAVVIKLGSLFISSGLGLVVLAKCAMVALDLVALWAALRLALALGGPTAALLAGALVAAFPALLVFGSRCMTETASGALVVLAAMLALTGESTRRRQWAAGAVAALSIYLRYQNGLLAVGLLVALLLPRRWRDARWFVEAALVVGVAGGLLDWATWGQPFHSFIHYVRFNLIEGRAANWGTAPADYYLRALSSSTGPAVLVVAAGLLFAGRRALALVALVVVYVAIHSAVPHKELRFLLPIMPLALALAAVGVARAVDKLRARWAPPVVAGALAAAMAWHASTTTFTEMGQPYGLGNEFSDGNSPWHAAEGVNYALDDAGRRADLCGLIVADIHPAVTGGYAYLHRDVPLLFYWPSAWSSANYWLGRAGHARPPMYTQVFQSGEYVLYRRDGACTGAPRGYNRVIR